MTTARILIVVCLCLLAGCRLPVRARDQPSGAGIRPLPEQSPLVRIPPPETEVHPAAFAQLAEPMPNESAAREPESILPAPDPEFGPPWDRELTLEQLEEIALATNPSLTEVRAHVNAAQGKWVQVGLYP
ncbi:MAG: hypothetical protein ABI614_29655, partial [Planctomycetota bacterium]